ncbi:MAG: ABC transporter permease/substrate-binding protein [Bacteroidaceae bacterium]
MDILGRRDYFYRLFSEHLLISFTALLLVSILGIGVGIWVFYSKRARTVVLPTVNFLYTIPSIAMFGLLIPLVGIGLKNALIVLVLYGLLPMVRNTFTGLKEVPAQFIEAAKGLGATPIQLFRKVYFPLALPSILSGLRITTVMIVALAGLAALIGAGGLGQAIFRGLNTMNTPLIVVGSLGISIFAIVGDKFIGTLEHNNNLLQLMTDNASRRQKRVITLNVITLCLLLLSAFIYINPLKIHDDGAITIASKPTSEQFILSEILAQAIENNTDIKVYRKFGIGGGTTNIHPALLAGKLDMYVEYNGTALMTVLKYNTLKTSQTTFKELQDNYQKEFNLHWVGLMGFNNTYSLAISKEEAKEKNIRTFSDLARYSDQYQFGAEFDFFEREDAYKGLIQAYPFHFANLHEMDINLRYQAFEDGQINALDVFTTDAQIEALNLEVLEDDKDYFPRYEAGIVVRQKVLEEHPEIEVLLNCFNGAISTDKMKRMNYEVEVLKKTPKEVATAFLEELKSRCDE